LVLAVFCDPKIVLFHICDDAFVLVTYGDKQVHKVYFALDGRALCRRWFLTWRLWQRRQGKSQGGTASDRAQN
jgi:hypothetical protein